MAIIVRKVSEAFYEAEVTSPHVGVAWSTSEPLRMHVLSRELVAKGLHQTDVGDAIDDADREWLINQKRLKR
jgi:hypothetical protein